MRIRWFWFALLFLLLISFSLAVAGAPRSEKEIPLYPGAARDQAAEKEVLEMHAEYMSENRRSHTVRAYKVKTIIDDVCKFYIDKLGAKPGAPLDDPYALEPGEVYSPWYELDFYGARIFEDQYEHDTLIQDGKWIRSAFEKRSQWKKGAWLCQAWFEWNIMLDNGDLATYTVVLMDEGYDWRKKVDFKTTQIRIEILVTKSEEALVEEWGSAMDEAMEEKARRFAKNPPTEKMLGIPLYPGAVFNPEISAGLSLDDDYHCYVFFSNDSPAKVAAFYQQRLNKEPSSSEGGYLFALKGKLPIPQEGLAIQPNMLFVGLPQTMISVQKEMRE